VETHEAEGEDLAEFGQALSRRHAIGMEGIGRSDAGDHGDQLRSTWPWNLCAGYIETSTIRCLAKHAAIIRNGAPSANVPQRRGRWLRPPHLLADLLELGHRECAALIPCPAPRRRQRGLDRSSICFPNLQHVQVLVHQDEQHCIPRVSQLDRSEHLAFFDGSFRTGLGP
jgi:hypothetical protein